MADKQECVGCGVMSNVKRLVRIKGHALCYRCRRKIPTTKIQSSACSYFQLIQKNHTLASLRPEAMEEEAKSFSVFSKTPPPSAALDESQTQTKTNSIAKK